MPSAVVLSHTSIAHELGHLGPWLEANDFTVTRLSRETHDQQVPRADLLIVLGSPASVATGHSEPPAEAEVELVSRWVGHDRPYLGLCFGAQVLARALGGAVHRMPRAFRSYTTLDVDAQAPRELAGPWTVWHDDAIAAPDGADVLASLDHADLAFRSGRAWGLQPHVEVTSQTLTRLAIGLGSPEQEWRSLVDSLSADERANRVRAHDLLDAFAADAMGD